MDILSTLNKSGTGLDLRSLATSLVTAEIAPKQQALQRKVEADTLRLTALGEVRAKLEELGSTLAVVAGKPILAVTTSSASILPSVTDRGLLRNGTTAFEVTSLAQRQVLEFKGFTARDAVVEAGTLTLEFGSWTGTTTQTFAPDASRTAVTLTVTAGTTLEALAEQVSTVSGMTARVLTKGDGTFSLGIVGETGAANAIRLAAAGTGGTLGGEVGLSTFDTVATNATTQVQAAADAQVIVDGILVSRTTNVLTDIVPGMSITLSAKVSGTITIERDKAIAQENMQALVDSFNETLALIKTVTSRGVNNTVAGDLAGDRSLDTVVQGIRALLARPLVGFGAKPVNLADLGIATERDGSLRLDQTALDRAFATDATTFDAVLGDSLSTPTAGLTAGGFASATLEPGEYDFLAAVDGSATLGGFAMVGADMDDGSRVYTAVDGPVQGLSIRAEAGVTSGTLRFGRSLVAAAASLLSTAMASNGAIGLREAEIGRSTETSFDRLSALEAKIAVLEKRYIGRFAAMERAVTQFNNTGTYLNNLVKMWTRSDS